MTIFKDFDRVPNWILIKCINHDASLSHYVKSILRRIQTKLQEIRLNFSKNSNKYSLKHWSPLDGAFQMWLENISIFKNRKHHDDNIVDACRRRFVLMTTERYWRFRQFWSPTTTLFFHKLAPTSKDVTNIHKSYYVTQVTVDCWIEQTANIFIVGYISRQFGHQYLNIVT